MDFVKGKALRDKAHELIPGASHTYAKGDDQYPELSPAFIDSGLGCRVRDLDGNEFIEYGMGLRSVTLGHAYPAVIAAVQRELQRGSNFTRPSPIEVHYAEALLNAIPTAQQVKFAKDGSAVTTAAIKLARAATGREFVALCADHPFFSYNDWFIGTTEVRAGIPDSAIEHSLNFNYNDPDSLRQLFEEYPGQIACVILEPEKDVPPQDNFLHKVRELCTKHGALLIFDEMITGFRWAIGGAQAVYNVTPDLSTFGKAIANGFAVSALLGKKEIMDLGGLRHDGERVFLLSSTHGGETHAIAAAMATLEVYQSQDVIAYLDQHGRHLQDSINSIAFELGLSNYFEVRGRPCCLAYVTRDEQEKPSQAFRALMLQELIRNGILAPSLVLSFSHDMAALDQTIDAFRKSLLTYQKALNGKVSDFLVGGPVKPVYRRFN
jgi:glutamate-1-semialdehyde 2,1-aminomutase